MAPKPYGDRFHESSSSSEIAKKAASMMDCRYKPAGCDKPASHFCEECAQGAYCDEHAARHNRIIAEEMRANGLDERHGLYALPRTFDKVQGKA